jgi:hypothetical protein
MTDSKSETSITVRADNTALRNKSNEVSAIRRSEDGAADHVQHIFKDYLHYRLQISTQIIS